jgi:hypothetical protein
MALSNGERVKLKGRLPGAVIFGVIAATVEIGLILWLAYC